MAGSSTKAAGHRTLLTHEELELYVLIVIAERSQIRARGQLVAQDQLRIGIGSSVFASATLADSRTTTSPLTISSHSRAERRMLAELGQGSAIRLAAPLEIDAGSDLVLAVLRARRKRGV